MSYYFPYLPWILAIVAVLLLAWLAWRRPSRRRLVWRLVASAVAGISLVLLLFPPTYQRVLDPTAAILLTEGYHADSLQALLRKLEPQPLVYTYKTKAPQAESIATLYTFRQQHPQVQTVHVLGHGLENQELQALGDLHLIPHLTAQPAGVTSVTWPATTSLGEAVVVAGNFKHTTNEEARLYLQAGGQVQDSVVVKESGNHTFRLRYTPKQEGRYTYNLLARTADRMDTIGQVPVQVKAPRQLGVLLVSSFPIFEFKFLKNHLGQLQHRVALRSTVSKGMHQSEWLNMPQADLNRITPRLLQQFDVVITEPQALQELSSTEKTALQRAVTEDGLGILTIAGKQPGNPNTAFFTNFPSKRLSQQDTRTARATWSQGTSAAVAALPYTLVRSEAVAGLVEEQQENNLLAASRKAGWGTVALTVVPQTFGWQLEGKQSTYASYWAYLLSSVAKRETREKFWQVKRPQFPQPLQPVTLSLTDYTLASAAEAPVATVRAVADSTQTGIALQQGVHQPEVYEGTFWPRRTGWHVVESPGVEPYHIFVQDSAAWPHQIMQAKREATLQFGTKQSSRETKGTTSFATEQVPVIWFFLLFVLSSGFLWLEEKL